MFMEMVRTKRPCRVRIDDKGGALIVLDENGDPAQVDGKGLRVWSPGRRVVKGLMKALDRNPEATDFEVSVRLNPPGVSPMFDVRVEPI